MDVQILPMQAADVPQVAELEKACFSDPWPESVLSNELENELSLWLVAKDKDTVLGYIGSQSVLDEADMMNIAVHPDFRRQGVARALILALIGELKKRGSRCLTLEVRASNDPARALYESLGFAHVGSRRNYYQNPKEDALILRKEWEI